MAEKVFAKADLLAIYDASLEHGDKIGTFRSKTMVGTLPATPVYRTHNVFATTTASFSETNLWLIVEHGIYIDGGGMGAIAEDHPYRQKEFGELTIERGLANSADIMRKVMAMADAWRAECKLVCPAGTVGESEVQSVLDAVREEYRKQGATIDDDGVIHVGMERRPDAVSAGK